MPKLLGYIPGSDFNYVNYFGATAAASYTVASALGARARACVTGWGYSASISATAGNSQDVLLSSNIAFSVPNVIDAIHLLQTVSSAFNFRTIIPPDDPILFPLNTGVYIITGVATPAGAVANIWVKGYFVTA